MSSWKHQIIFYPVCADERPLLLLAVPMLLERRNCQCAECDLTPTTRCFWRAKDHLPYEMLEREAHLNKSRIRVDISPVERQQFTPSHARCKRQDIKRLKWIIYHR